MLILQNRPFIAGRAVAREPRLSRAFRGCLQVSNHLVLVMSTSTLGYRLSATTGIHRGSRLPAGSGRDFHARRAPRAHDGGCSADGHGRQERRAQGGGPGVLTASSSFERFLAEPRRRLGSAQAACPRSPPDDQTHGHHLRGGAAQHGAAFLISRRANATSFTPATSRVYPLPRARR
jgi:hypothetical protein